MPLEDNPESLKRLTMGNRFPCVQFRDTRPHLGAEIRIAIESRAHQLRQYGFRLAVRLRREGGNAGLQFEGEREWHQSKPTAEETVRLPGPGSVRGVPGVAMLPL